jgi:hypothetical protein
MITAVVTHPYKAIVQGATVYAGDDVELAMATFEAFADAAGVAAGAGMMIYMCPPSAPMHMAPGFQGRPVVEAHAMGGPDNKSFVGCLYGVTNAQWQGRKRL